MQEQWVYWTGNNLSNHKIKNSKNKFDLFFFLLNLVFKPDALIKWFVWWIQYEKVGQVPDRDEYHGGVGKKIDHLPWELISI